MYTSDSRDIYLLEDEDEDNHYDKLDPVINNDNSNNQSATSPNAYPSSSHINCKAEYLISQLNATNIKKLAVTLVLAFIVLHGFLHWQYGICSFLH